MQVQMIVERYFTLTKSLCRAVLAVSLIVLSYTVTHAQIEQLARYEVGLSFNSKDIQLIPNGQRGLFLFHEIDQFNPEGNFWRITKLDTALNELWNRVFIVDRDYSVSNTDTLDGTAFILLANRRDFRNTQILKVYANGRITTTPFRNVVPMSVERFMVFDGGKKLLLGGYFNYRPVIIIYDLEKQRPIIVPGLINSLGTLLQLERDEKNRSISALIKSAGKNTRGIWLKTYDYEGSLKKNILLDFPWRKSLLNGRVVQLDRETHLIVGPYGLRNSQYSRGLYVGLIGEDDIYSSKTINYADLPNFFDYMKLRRQQRIAGRIERKRSKGKEPRFHFKVLIQDLKEDGEDFIVMGEAHYIKYNQAHRQFLDYGSNLNRMMFDGYVYTHAFLVGLDFRGEINWDQSIRTRNIKKYDLDQLVHFSTIEDKGVLMYPSREKIRYTAFEMDLNGDSEESEVDIKLKYPNDIVRSKESNSSDIKFWYNNYYFVHGMQDIKNLTDNEVPLNRQVYYVNKIQYSGGSDPN